MASFYGDFASVQFYLQNGADPKIVDSKNRKDVLDFASSDSVRKYIIDLKDAARRGIYNTHLLLYIKLFLV